MRELWVTNLTKMDISISDLNIIVRSMASVNLLSPRLKLDRKKIANSLESGTLKKKKNYLILGLGKPKSMVKADIKVENKYIPDRSKSIIVSNTVEISLEEQEKIKKTDEEFILKQLEEEDGANDGI